MFGRRHAGPERSGWLARWRRWRRTNGRIRRNRTGRIWRLANRQEKLVRRVEQILRRHRNVFGFAAYSCDVNRCTSIALSVKDILVINLQIVKGRRFREWRVDCFYAGHIHEQPREG